MTTDEILTKILTIQPYYPYWVQITETVPTDKAPTPEEEDDGDSDTTE